MVFTLTSQSSRRRVFRVALFAILSLVIYDILQKLLATEPKPPPTCTSLCSHSSKLSRDTLEFDPSHVIRHFPEFVCPQNFRNLADWVYGWPHQFHETLEISTADGKSIAPCLPTGSIIYVRIWVMGEFFDRIYPHLKNDFVLVTGEGDVSSPTHLKYLQAPDSKIIHWFGQNGQYDVSQYEKFTHLPIGKDRLRPPLASSSFPLGINCFEMADAIRQVHSLHRNYTLPSVFNDIDEPPVYVQPQDASQRALTTTVPTKQLVLLNFDPVTDGSRLRVQIWKTMCHKKTAPKFPFATCIAKAGGVHIDKLPSIYERNRAHPFWLSPRGGGLDCHRTWEALYLDIIPIVWNSSLNVLYENLPVVIINSEQELNEDFLRAKLREISTKKQSRTNTYQFDKIRHAYWRRLILDKSRHRRLKRSVYQRYDQCWRAKNTHGWRNYISPW